MHKQLCITCPISSSETFLRQIHPRTELFFLSAVAGNAAGLDAFTLEETTDFIRREKISSICVVNDVSCPFIEEVVEERCTSGLQAINLLQDIYIEHYFTSFRDQSLGLKKNQLAELHVEYQLQAILTAAFVGQQIRQSRIQVKGLVTNRMARSWKQINGGIQLQTHRPLQMQG